MCLFFRRMSETPTTTTSHKSIAIHLQFVLQYAANLYCSTPPICILQCFRCHWALRKGNFSVTLPFVSQYASHLYRNTPPICIAILFGKSWWLWSPGCSPFLQFPESFRAIFSLQRVILFLRLFETTSKIDLENKSKMAKLRVVFFFCFFGFKVILTSEGYLLKIALKDSWGWAKSHDSYRRITGERYRHNSITSIRWQSYLHMKHRS